jgi:Tfp pilus assembly protein FimV
VVSGDSLSAICEARRPARMTVTECVEAVRQLNGLTSDNISVGQVLRLPE